VGRTLLALVARMPRHVVRGGGIVNRMLGRRAASSGDTLGASQMQRRFAGYFASETEPASAVMASLVGHRAHGVALGVIA
jgi:hypothetical protein